MAAMQAQIQKINFQPYTYSSYKEKFDEKYTNLGGLGNQTKIYNAIGSNKESHEWKQASQKKKRMEVISKSIDFMNKKKYHSLTHDESLKSTIKEAKEKINSQNKLNINDYIIRKIEGRLRREKALSYAEKIKKPSVTSQSNFIR